MIQWFRENILKEKWVNKRPILSTLEAYKYFQENPEERKKAIRFVEQTF